MRRIGFILQSKPGNWLGGLSYLRNLLNAIHANPDRSIEPVLLVRPGLATAFLAGFPAVEIISTSLAIRLHPARLAGKAALRTIQRDPALEVLMRRHHLAALSHSGPLGARSALTAIGWIPDFQHARIPQFFTRAERRERDSQFGRLIAGCRRIILSSEDSLRDFAAYAPQSVHKARVLHFVSTFEDTGHPFPHEQLQKRFGIERPYFLLPNQFWAHKNHSIVIEALAILRSRGSEALVLATGKTDDYRNPGHFARLLARAKELGVEDSFRTLGMVTLPELRSLMMEARALINPSLFEGWSTTVEEAKSLGLRAILSDIPVHIEQAPPLGTYFRSGSAVDLADSMLEVLRSHDPQAAAALHEAAAAALPGRMRQFGKAYEDIALSALAH